MAGVSFSAKKLFQFPSNGKVLSDAKPKWHCCASVVPSFNSLQTGKSFRTDKGNLTDLQNVVSIPFKRESPFGPLQESSDLKPLICFNSLQTGKSFRTILPHPHHRSNHSKFQFPSNGKVLSDKRGSQTSIKNCRHYVSIPFKRESPFGQKNWNFRGTVSSRVSIPFKRESPFGLMKEELKHKFVDINVSIPFKRESPFGQH